MKLTDEIRNRVDGYFSRISPEDFASKMESKYGFQFDKSQLQLMIQITELRIGSWICDDEGTYAQIVTLGDKMARCKYTGYLITENIKYVLLDPIPLTPELLEKCGFVRRDDGFYVKPLIHARLSLGFYKGQYDKMTLFQMQGPSYDTATEFQMNFGSNSPQFLHQLQNLYFALTGEELEVNL